MRPFLIDTDTASDDAVALIMALRAPDVRVVAITTVAGNMPLEQATHNALYTVALCGADVPVTRGARKPLTRANAHAEWFHGKDGLSDQGYTTTRQPTDGHAVDVIIETIRQYAGEIVLVTLGPLTNIALAVSRAPEIVGMVNRCIVMGGAACTVGNVTPAAEYNIWVDPEAAQIVFESGLPIEMVGWEHSRDEKLLNEQEIEQVLSFGNPLAQFAIECNDTAIKAYFTQTGETGLSLPDPVAMAVALDPTIATETGIHYVQIETDSPLTRGMTVVDQLAKARDERNRAQWQQAQIQPPHVRVVWQIDAPRWKELLYRSLRSE